MLLYGDYHVHSKYSKHMRGVGTILQNASVASDKGLKQIAITDYGFANSFFGIKRQELPLMKEDALNAKEVTGVDVLVGIEANLISLNGLIDLNEEDFDNLDVVLVGLNKFVTMDRMKDKYMLNYANSLRKIFKSGKERTNRNTTAFLKTLDRYPIDVLTHLNYGFETDTIAIAKMAKQKGVMIELSGKHLAFTDEEIQIMASEGVKFILSSDARKPEDVGEVDNGLNLIFKYNIPLSQVVNVDKFPKFSAKRGL